MKSSAYRGTLPRIRVRLFPLLTLRPLTRPTVRKAYKKRALQTHPDRVPPEQKTTAEDEFRKVLPVPLFDIPRCVAHS